MFLLVFFVFSPLDGAIAFSPVRISAAEISRNAAREIVCA